MGVRTILVEQTGMIGGISTAGLMSHWTGHTQGGIYEEIIERSCIMPMESLNPKSQFHTINQEKLKLAYLEMLEEAHVDILMYSFASLPIMANKALSGIVIENKSGRQAILGKVVIDASGDGDIAAKAGVKYSKGREEDQKMQPMTLMFMLGGVDMEKAILPGSFESNIDVPKGEIQTLARDHLPSPMGHVLLYPSTLPNSVVVNMTNIINVDGTNTSDLTRAHLESLRQIDLIIPFLQEFAPGYEKCYLICSAPLIGVRETRHFECLYSLTEEDIMQAKLFEDWVVTRAHFNFDIHNVTGSGLDEKGVQQEFKQRKGYSIPYRCFIPKTIDGLLLAGRETSRVVIKPIPISAPCQYVRIWGRRWGLLLHSVLEIMSSLVI